MLSTDKKKWIDDINDELKTFFPDINELTKTLDDNSNSIFILKESGLFSTFRKENMGSGILNIAFFLTWIKILKKNKYLFIEEPELFIYPGLQKKLLEKFLDVSDDIKIYVTTHSKYFLSANDNICSVYFLQKINNASIAYKIPKEDFPEIYKNLYVLSSGIINLGYYGTIQIDKFQYDFIYEFYTDFKDNYLKSSELYRYGSFSNKLSTSVINSNNKDVWKCPKKSCNHEVIKITRNKDNIIDNKTYTSIIIHFLRHLSRENPLFGGMDIFKIFLEHSPEEVLSNEDLGQYEYDGRVSDTIWKNQIRSSLNSLRSRRLIETEASSELIQNCSIDIKDKRKFRKRKRSKTFFDKFEIYNDWSLYLNEIPIGKETSISEDSISQKNTSIFTTKSYGGYTYLISTSLLSISRLSSSVVEELLGA